MLAAERTGLYFSLLLLSGACDAPVPSATGAPPDLGRRPAVCNRWDNRIRSPTSLVAVGEDLHLETPCQCPTWSLEEPAGATLMGFPGGVARFVAQRPGTYTIRLVCRDLPYLLPVTAYQPSVSLVVEHTVRLPLTCTDAAATPQGRLLCVNNGVTVIDPQTGAALGRTAENSPTTWGIAAASDLFATGSTGCEACPSCCPRCPGLFACGGCCPERHPPGLFLYRLGRDDRITALYTDTSIKVDAVAFSADRLVATAGSTYVYDIRDPARPVRVACAKPAVVPVILDDGLFLFSPGGSSFLISGPGRLSTYRLSALKGGCAAQADPLAELVLPPLRRAEYAQPVAARSFLYAPGNELIAIDARDPMAPVRAQGFSEAGSGAMAISGGLLIMRANDRVLAFDLTDPGTPRPVGQLVIWLKERARPLAAPAGLWVLDHQELLHVAIR
jgi:hypothetical protein